MDEIGLSRPVSSRLVSSRTVPFARGPLKGMMFFSSIKGRASPSLVFPCTYPSVNTTHPSVSEYHKSSACLQETIVNQSLTIVIVNQSLARSLARSLVKNKKLSVFFFFVLFLCQYVFWSFGVAGVFFFLSSHLSIYMSI
jgi:hypothetical protein